MAAPNLYLGGATGPDLSSFGSPTIGVGVNPSPYQGPRPIGSPIRTPQAAPSAQNPPTPFQGTDFGWGQPSNVDTSKGGTIEAQGVRATGPSQGYDPSYLQNLATSAGGNFARPAGQSAVSVDPLGNLSDITKLLMSFGNPSPMQGFGNAPTPGLPQNLLQLAQIFNPTALGTKGKKT